MQDFHVTKIFCYCLIQLLSNSTLNLLFLFFVCCFVVILVGVISVVAVVSVVVVAVHLGAVAHFGGWFGTFGGWFGRGYETLTQEDKTKLNINFSK